MYRKTFICLFSFNDREVVDGLASDVRSASLAEAVADFHPDYGCADALVPASAGASASEVKNPRGARMPVKRSHHGCCMTRSKVSVNAIQSDLKEYCCALLYPSGKEKSGHHLICLGKLII